VVAMVPWLHKDEAVRVVKYEVKLSSLQAISNKAIKQHSIH